tara:strand:- start:2256 stop:3422 length:1167 start_codon:yes stop_codon:yes gene_type:complete
MISYPLASSTWDDREIKAIQNVIDQDNFTMGSYVKKFENHFSKYFKAKYSVMVSSGSTANLLAVAALFFTRDSSLKRGDEVIVPAVSWSTTYFPLQQYGLKLKFVDIDIDTLNYDITALSNAVSNKTKIIMAVNLLGNPNNYDVILDICNENNITLLEDNCESMGATFKNKFAGTFGLMGTFSSFFSHHISTMEGGVVVTDDKELYHILLCLRAHGWTRNLPDTNFVSNKSNNWFDESFRFVLPGYNVRPLEMSGAIGIEQMKKLNSFLENRRKNAKIFKNLFQSSENFIIQEEICNSSWFGFSLIIRPQSRLNRNEIIKKLSAKNIDCRPIVTGNFTKNEVMRYFDYSIHADLKNADYLHDNGFFVGNHHTCLDNEINYLYEVLNNI